MSDHAFRRVFNRAREEVYSLAGAWALAVRWTDAKVRAEQYGIDVSWEDEIESWERGDFEDEPPAIWSCAVVWDPSHAPWKVCLASLGGVGLNSWEDAYVYEVEADLLNEACDTLEAERDREACEMADELASRATYAAGG